MGLILFLGFVNYFGVKVGGDVQVVVTIVKVALILLIVIAGLGWGHPAVRHSSVFAPLTVLGFFAALVKSLWAYDGWNNVSMVASEIRRPQRNLPLALFGARRRLSAFICWLIWPISMCFRPEAGGRQQSGGCGDDAAGVGTGRREPGFHRGHDLDFCRSEWFDSLGRPCSIRPGPRRIFFCSGGPRQRCPSYAWRRDYGLERHGA